MASSITNVKVGSASITFGGVDLGLTKDGVEVTYTPTYFDASVDKYGKTPINKYLTTEKVEVKTKLAEHSMTLLSTVFPWSALLGTVNQKLTFGSISGKSGQGKAATLVLHPYANITSDKSEDFTLTKAFCVAVAAIPYKIDGERVYQVTFEALIDESQADGSYLGYFGYATTT